MKRIVHLAVAATLMAGAWSVEPIRAEICAIDAVPAATLLLPYFGVDPDKKNAPDTVFSLNNASATTVEAQVTVWTTESSPAISFIVPLTGYDIETISLRDLFNGKLPPSVEEGCILPNAAVLKKAKNKRGRGGRHTRLVEKLTDKGALALAEGYITIDSVDGTCASLLPNEEGYFENGGTGIATNENKLYGEVYTLNKKKVAAYRMVSIEAADSVGSPNTYTFYGRYSGYDGRDNREPLADDWAVRYSNIGKGQAYLQVWRDSGPLAFPLSQSQVVFFDLEENPMEVSGDDYFPLEAQEVEIGKGLPAPYDSGWIFLNLNVDDPFAILQSFVVVRQDFRKRSSLFPALSYNESESGLSQAATLCGVSPPATPPSQQLTGRTD